MNSILWAQLDVADLPGQSRFYQDVLGLDLLQQEPSREVLGMGDRPLLQLVHCPQARLSPVAQPGLFHLAFLLPARSHLGAWLGHARRLGTELEGGSDHGVSEALYLSDREGNGLEIYADRPPVEGPITMDTRRLDLHSLAQAAVPWQGAPVGTRLGHIHLRHTDRAVARSFFDSLGLHTTFAVSGAEFFAWNGYHRHFAVNQWGVSPARPGCWTGLSGYALEGDWPDQVLLDPWGHRVVLNGLSG